MRLRRVFLVTLSLLGPLIIAIVGLTAIDLFFHHRYLEQSGYNAWGYRGPALGAKRDGEVRLVLLGGSTAFGYGVKWNESISAYLERKLNERLQPGASASVVNLAFMGEGSYSFQFTLRDYDYLRYDAAIFYEGYNDVTVEPNRAVFRHTSPVFRLTGYMPILPVILREKVMQLRAGGDLNAAYRGERAVFSPSLADRTKASAIEAAATVTNVLARQLDRIARQQAAAPAPQGGTGCGHWDDYCANVGAAADYALARGRAVVVVGQPTVTDLHVGMKAALQQFVETRYRNQRVRYIDVGRAVDVSDKNIAFDGVHLVREGNAKVAETIFPAVVDVLETTRKSATRVPHGGSLREFLTQVHGSSSRRFVKNPRELP